MCLTALWTGEVGSRSTASTVLFERIGESNRVGQPLSIRGEVKSHAELKFDDVRDLLNGEGSRQGMRCDQDGEGKKTQMCQGL